MPGQKEPSSLYTLSFKVSLKHDKDEVYVAMCYPYTYTDCVNFLDKILFKPYIYIPRYFKAFKLLYIVLNERITTQNI